MYSHLPATWFPAYAWWASRVCSQLNTLDAILTPLKLAKAPCQAGAASANLDLALPTLKAPHQRIVSYREQNFAANPCQYFGMMKKSIDSIVPVRTTIASVHKEMQKPRLTESVRNHGRGQVVPARVPVSDRRPSL